MVRIGSFGAASRDVFISGKGIKAQLDPRTNEFMEEFSGDFKLGAKIGVDKIDFSTGGGATNAAVTFARQGLESSFIGKLGNDSVAKAVVVELNDENVDTSRLIYHPSLGTQYSTILLADNGERTILIYRGAAHSHEARDYEPIDFASFDWIYVSSFAGAFDALAVVLEKAKSCGAKVMFNPGDAELSDVDKLRQLLPQVDILSVNKEEAGKITEGEEPFELVSGLLKTVSVAIVSDGPNGVVASDRKSIIKAGMYEDVPVIDRTGAGDAFGSGFLSQWANGKSLKESIVFASANSTSVVGQIGAKVGILRAGTQLHDMETEEKDV